MRRRESCHLNYEEIVKVLHGMAMDVFRTCEGCELEENCSVRGCAVMLSAADAMENLQTENAALHQIAEKQAEMNQCVAEMAVELDAAVEDIRKMIICEFGSVCEFCVHDENQNAGCIKENGFGAWCCKNAAWRGPQKEA